MVPFAGYSMPLSYGETGQSECFIMKTLIHTRSHAQLTATAHKHVRSDAGLFDVSHMLQHNFTGPTAQEFLLTLCPSSLDSLKPFTSTLSVLLNEQGGIIDDTIITKHSDTFFYVVTNAGRADEDKAHITQKLDEWNAAHQGQKVKWETLDGWGLLALQGPKAKDVLQRMTDQDLSQVKFGSSVFADIKTTDGQVVKCHIARGGYTGEDGFEVWIVPWFFHSYPLTPILPL